MSKNKGGREVRKPKQIKATKPPETTAQALHVESTKKPRHTK